MEKIRTKKGWLKRGLLIGLSVPLCSSLFFALLSNYLATKGYRLVGPFEYFGLDKPRLKKLSETEKLLRMSYYKIDDMNDEVSEMRAEMAQMRETIREQAEALEEQAEALDSAPKEPSYVAKYKREIEELNQFYQRIDLRQQAAKSSLEPSKPDISGTYYQRQIVGPNAGEWSIQYIRGPK